MKVGDLVVQAGWEADGLGIILATGNSSATVLWSRTTGLWSCRKVNMLLSQLVLISEGR